jgi:hypothetical protein
LKHAGKRLRPVSRRATCTVLPLPDCPTADKKSAQIQNMLCASPRSAGRRVRESERAMSTVRKLASKISLAVVRFASPATRDWAIATQHELDFIEGDWKACLWAIGSVRILFAPTNAARAEHRDISQATQRLAKIVRKRNVKGYSASFFVMAAFTWYFFVLSNTIQRVGSLLTVLVAGYLVYQLCSNQLQQRESAITLAKMGNTPSLESYRVELQRQRDFHKGSRFWSRLLIMMPGPFIFLVGIEIAHPESATFIRLEGLAFLLLAAIAVPLNLRKAHQYQRQIELLDSLPKSS